MLFRNVDGEKPSGIISTTFRKDLWTRKKINIKTVTHKQRDRQREREKDIKTERKRDRHKDREKKRQNLEFQILTRFEVKDIIRNKVC